MQHHGAVDLWLPCLDGVIAAQQLKEMGAARRCGPLL